ncbi:MAG: hypothetical protein RR220_06660 [Bacteroidaceae bacterium]
MANRITIARNAINKAIVELQAALDFGAGELEVELGDNTMVYVKLNTYQCDNCNEMEITQVEVMKDTERRECNMPNIALFIAESLDKTAKDMNIEDREDAKSWEYQKEYETITGRYAYNY